MLLMSTDNKLFRPWDTEAKLQSQAAANCPLPPLSSSSSSLSSPRATHTTLSPSTYPVGFWSSLLLQRAFYSPQSPFARSVQPFPFEARLPKVEPIVPNVQCSSSATNSLPSSAPLTGNGFMQLPSTAKPRRQRPKRFRCPHCHIAFSNNGQLKGHIRTHTGERPFVCEHSNCGKTFTRNEELTRHRRIHTGIRPYSCSVCGKKFGRKDHLKKHQRTHERRLNFVLPTGSMAGMAPIIPSYFHPPPSFVRHH
ncbi:Transcription factor Sp5 [Halotydeus destructor]|nr:Transcription factor Sp5 [Halotydeus destructor]